MFDIRRKLGVDPSWKVGLYEKGFRRDRPVGLRSHSPIGLNQAFTAMKSFM